LRLLRRPSVSQNADYVKAFPTAADYGTAATQWAAAITAAHTGVAIAALASPVKPGTAPPRQQTWNAGLFSTLRGVSAVTMHEYTDTQIGSGSGPVKFGPADVPVVLGAPFYWVDAIAARTATLPPSVTGGVWLTEFNLKDDQVTGICGTWAHGLYLATEATLLLAHAINASTPPSAKVSLAIPWQFLGDASMGSVFATASDFNFADSPDPELPTTPYNRSAAGFTLGALAAASHGHTSAAALAFSPNPPAHGAHGLVYGTILGIAFSGSSSGHASGVDSAGGDAAFVLNLGAAPYTLDALSLLPGNMTRFETASAAPTAAVNADSVVAVQQGALPPDGSLLLPPYSATTLLSVPGGSVRC
jgi:hypothetical protein